MEFNPSTIHNRTDKLLYCVLMELRSLNEKLEKTTTVPELVTETKKFACKHCEEGHDTKPELMVCARKNKKVG